MYKIENLSKIYKTGEVETKALDDVCATIEEDQFIVILGESGSGKSTLLNMLGGLDEPTSGEIIYNGKKISEMSEEQKAHYRSATIGFVFQNYNLMPTLSVYENVILPILIAKKQEDKEYVYDLLECLGIAEKKDSFPSQLSGGQQQRAAIARAFANKPSVILADEPTGNLDSKNGDLVVEMLLQMQKKFHQTIIMITHNEKIAQKADCVIRIQDGRIV